MPPREPSVSEGAYLDCGGDSVRDRFERRFFARLIPRLLADSRGASMLDLGCGDGLAAELAGERLERYLGVDLRPSAGERGTAPGDLRTLRHDLREGLGAVGAKPFDLYFGSFGVASHLAPGELEQLLGQIARHGRRGSLVALEALGRYSLEWPGLWESRPGEERSLPYRLGADVQVHPWAPAELGALAEGAGLVPLWALDRTLQAGPKTDGSRYWPQLPPLRNAFNLLLEGRASGVGPAGAPVPPLPAHPAAPLHHELGIRRLRLVEAAGSEADPVALAEALWRAEPATAGGYGHGLLVVARVP